MATLNEQIDSEIAAIRLAAEAEVAKLEAARVTFVGALQHDAQALFAFLKNLVGHSSP